MSEANLRAILIEQGPALKVGEIHLPALRAISGTLTERDFDLVTVDAMTDADLGLAARTLLFDAADESPIFCVGSGGLSYGIGSALVGLENPPVNEAALLPSGIALAVSGSCSGRTAQQIQQAIGARWADLRIDPNRIDAGVERAIAAATHALRSGRSVVAYTALGRADGDFSAARIGHARARLVEAGS